MFQPPAHEADIFDQVNQLSHLLKSQMRAAVFADIEGVPPMAARALAFIVRTPGSTPSDLVAHSGRDKAQIARLIKYLEDERYVTRTADPNDGRSYSLALTERGRAVQKKTQTHRKRVMASLLSGISEHERTLLGALLNRLLANIGSEH